MDSINDMKEILGASDDDFIQKLKELDKQNDEYKNELENFIDFTQKVQNYGSGFIKGLDNTLNISSFVLQFKQY
ncbi:hypothetical protein [Campylobacter majalis]|nr:hypothetical protein [Campylobacter majalis]